MSNALAIAHVTQALALLIEANLQPDIDMAVKVEPRKPPADPPTEPTITVFLYQVTPNTSLRNHDLPTRASDGTLLKRPAAALDLHFLISAYGEESELVGQRLIGSVVRTLHEIPVLPQDIIELAGERPHLTGSDLAESAQRVRFSPTVMDIDETSKLWGMLHQTPYTLSVVYQGVLVFIEGREKPTPAKPVERHTVRVLPFGAPGAPERPGSGSGSGNGRPEPEPEPQPVAEPTKKAAAKQAAKAAPAKKTAEKSAEKTAEKSVEKADAKAETKAAQPAAAEQAPAKKAPATTPRPRKQTQPGGRRASTRAATKRTGGGKPADNDGTPESTDGPRNTES